MTQHTTNLNLSSLQKAEKTPPQKAVWKKPELKQLQISLDTAFLNGSGSDGTRGSMP